MLWFDVEYLIETTLSKITIVTIMLWFDVEYLIETTK